MSRRLCCSTGDGLRYSDFVATESQEGAPPEREGDGDVHTLFPASSILLSSLGAGWRSLEAERMHLTLETEPHHHDDHFLTIQLAPSALIEVKEGRHHRRIQPRPGEFTLIGANVPHQVRYQNADVLAISLRPELVESIAESGIARPAASETLELISQHGTYDPQVERIGQLIKAEMETGYATGPLFADSLAHALTAHLLRRYSRAATPASSEAEGALSPLRLRRVLDYLEENLGQDISLAELAGVADLSPYHFARQFKAATGMAPHAYLIFRRIERAKEMLTRTDAPLATIAAATGFSHQSHFTRHFKRLVGTTPALFR